jgi:hypothetical protein
MRVAWVLVGSLLALGCGAASQPDGGSLADASVPQPDFSLLDVNPASASAGHSVSPRDYQGRVSAWYFGHSS